jgi:hypothetical protein
MRWIGNSLAACGARAHRLESDKFSSLLLRSHAVRLFQLTTSELPLRMVQI